MKIQYSKILPFSSIIIFCICLYMGYKSDASDIADLSLYISAITVSGTMSLTTIVWYMKNSQAEKVARIKADTYRIASEERYKYNKKMLELKIKYALSNEEVSEIEDESPMDELESQALDSLMSSIDSAMEEASSPIEIQNI